MLRKSILVLLAAAISLIYNLSAYAQCSANYQPPFITGGSVFGYTANQWAAFFGGKVDVNNGTLCNPTITGSLTLNGNISTGGLTVTGASSFAGAVTISNSTASTSPTTGALIVTGGLGLGGAFNTAGAISTTNNTPSINTTTGALIVTGGAGVGGNLNIGGNLNVGGNLSIPAPYEGANLFYAGPTSGVPAQAGFRTIVAADLSGVPAGGDLSGSYPNPTVKSAAGNLTVGGAITSTPVLTIGPGAYQPSSSATYYALTASGALTSANTLLLPAGPTWPFTFTKCSDTVTASGGSQSNPLIATCHSIYMPNIGAGSGDRAALDIGMQINGSTAQTEGDAYYNGAVATILANSNLGGTTGAKVGDVYGLSTQIALKSGATNYASVHGAGEWDLQVDSGASVANKIGGEIALVTGDDVQGSNIDAGFLFTDNGSTSWNYGIEFGLPAGQSGSFPVSGTIIGSYAGTSQGSTASVAFGIDFHNVKFTNAALSLPGFAVLGSGHITTSNYPGTAASVSACGTSATMESGSNDTRGLVNIGTGSVTSCTVTFGSAFTTAPGGIPNCIIQGIGNFVTWPTFPNSSTLQINFAASEPSVSVVYHCWE